MAEKFGLQPDQRIPGRLALTRGSLPVGVGTHGFPMGRLVRAEEIADVIVFTAGPKLA